MERPEYTYDDRAAFNAAYAGVRPLARSRRGASGKNKATVGSTKGTVNDTALTDHEEDASIDDDEVRDHLDALVGRGVRFEVERDTDGRVTGVRSGAGTRALVGLASGKASPEASLDLHGCSEETAAREVTRFVRLRHRRGNRVLLVVHGQGRHSEGGIGVLGDCVVRALTEGGAAPLVLAFCSASLKQGGTGALLVRLK